MITGLATEAVVQYQDMGQSYYSAPLGKAFAVFSEGSASGLGLRLLAVDGTETMFSFDLADIVSEIHVVLGNQYQNAPQAFMPEQAVEAFRVFGEDETAHMVLAIKSRTRRRTTLLMRHDRGGIQVSEAVKLTPPVVRSDSRDWPVIGPVLTWANWLHFW